MDSNQNKSLTVPDSGLATLLATQTLNLNVLLKDIIVLETKVAGTMFYEPEEFEPLLKTDSILKMQREPENPYDKFAIALLFEESKIGYIPRSQNEVIARLMDAGKEFTAKVRGKKWYENSNELKVNIEISMKG